MMIAALDWGHNERREETGMIFLLFEKNVFNSIIINVIHFEAQWLLHDY